MFSSEQKFSVNGEGKDNLTATLQLALKLYGSKVRAYELTDYGITLYWHNVSNSSPLPGAGNNVDTLGNLIWDHLSDAEVKDKFRSAVKKLDIDGSINLGWKVYIPGYRGFSNHAYCVVAVSLDWLYYAK